MGGAIAVQAASRNVAPSLCGLVVIDVVEGVRLLLSTGDLKLGLKLRMGHLWITNNMETNMSQIIWKRICVGPLGCAFTRCYGSAPGVRYTGTALESLSHMHTVIANRPRMFKSLPFAIEWR
jgi:hypothetical protein